MTPRDLPPSINLFKGVRILDDGSLEFDGRPAVGRHVELRADLDVVVLLVNAPHPLDPRPTYEAAPARVTAWRASAPVDVVTSAGTPERERAYLNTAQYVCTLEAGG
jgi:hypothetical protein